MKAMTRGFSANREREQLYYDYMSTAKGDIAEA